MTEVAAKACTQDGCKRPYRAKGYCNVHYKQWRHGDLPKNRYKICSAEACKKKRHLHGLCEVHYKEAYNIKDEQPAEAAAE